MRSVFLKGEKEAFVFVHYWKKNVAFDLDRSVFLPD